VSDDTETDVPTPRVTVIIPTYNYAGVLPYSVGSVLDQTFRDFELLVVGDGCTDESERVITAFDDPRVHWINLPRNTRHQAGPNNEGLRCARGAVIAYLGHDDLWLPNHLDVLTKALDRDVPAAHTSVLYVDPCRPCFTGPEPGWSYTRGAWLAPTSLAIRRRDAIAVGGWRYPEHTGYLNPEADLLARLCDAAGPPEWVPRVTCIKITASSRRDVYRIRPTHEQAYWLTQLRTADDAERVVEAHIGRPYDLAGDRVAPIAMHARVWRSARYRIRKQLGLPTHIKAKTKVRRLRRYKGLR